MTTETARPDALAVGMAYEGQVRAYACYTTNLAGELARRHQTWPVATDALARVLTVGSIMGAMLKGQKDRITLQVKGDGPLGQIVVDATQSLDVRGYVEHPQLGMVAGAEEATSVGPCVGQGMLYVVRDMGLKYPYRGSVPLVSGEIGDDFTYYFAKSEQTPSAVGVGSSLNAEGKVSVAGGFVIQMMPFAEESVIQAVEQAVGRISSVTALLGRGLAPHEMLQEVLQTKVQLLDERRLRFQCTCSRERIARVLLGFNDNTLETMVKEGKSEQVECQFCNEQYTFTPEELKALLAEQPGSSTASSLLH